MAHRTLDLAVCLVGGLLALAGGWQALGQLLPVDPANGWTLVGLAPPERLGTAIRGATLRYDAAMAAADRRAGATHLGAARAMLEARLGQTPADGMLWAQAAELEVRRSGWSPLATAYLETSYLYSRLEFGAIGVRLALAVRMWPALGPAQRALIDRDLRTFLAFSPKTRTIAYLAQLAQGQPPPQLELLRHAVSTWAPDWLTTYEQFRRVPPKL